MQINYLTTQSAADQAVEELQKVKKICLDFETTGLSPWLAEPRLLQICDSSPSVEDRTIYVFDLFKINPTNVIKYVRQAEMLVIHNANFDLQFLLKMGLDYQGKVFDTMLAERCLRAGFKEKRVSPKANKPYFADISNSLKAVAERRLEIEVDKEEQASDWSQEDLSESQIEYAAKDVNILPDIAADQLRELAEENLLEVYTLESKCIRPVALMCYRGFGVDLSKLTALKSQISKELDKATKVFCESLDSRLPDGSKLPREVDGTLAIGKNAKKQFNPGSGIQVIKCFKEIGIATPMDARTGKPTLNQVALAEFNSEDETMNMYRSRVKTETKLEHIEKLIENINPVTHRIHSGYRQYGANSGRFTSSGVKRTAASKVKKDFGVNIQQVPRGKEFRECFVPTEGYTLIVCDFSQIELRLGAELVNIPQMIEAFQNGHDLHTVTASLIYNIPLEEVTKNQRQDGKTLNFALLYGMGFRKYKTYAAQSGKVLTLSEAKLAHAAFHRAYPRLREWHKERAALVADGWCYVRTPIGRRRLLSYDDASFMVAANTLIQGAGADILKLSLANLNEHLDGINCHLLACVHDEIVIEAKTEKAQHYKEVLEQCMKSAAEKILKLVPVKADALMGDSWAEK